MIIHKFQQCYKFPYFITLPLDNHKNIVTTSLKTLPVKPSGTKPGRRKKSAVYPYYHSLPHVNMIMIFSTFQMVDLSIFVFQSHTLIFSMWSKVKPLSINLLDYCIIEFVEHQSHISHGACEYRKI